MLIWSLIFSSHGSCWVQVMPGSAELPAGCNTATLLWQSRPGSLLRAAPWPGHKTRELQQLWWPLHKVQKMSRFCSAQTLCWPFTTVQDGYQLLAVSFPVFCKCVSQMFRVTCSTTTEKTAYMDLPGGVLRLVLSIQYIAIWVLPCNLLSGLQME